MSQFTLILGNQLFDSSFYQGFPKKVFMAEDRGLCTHFKYHKHKIIHFLASMRIFAQKLDSEGFETNYVQLENSSGYLKDLKSFIGKHGLSEVHLFEIEDLFFETELMEFFAKEKVEVEVYQSPMFLCSRDEFRSYLGSVKRPHLNDFYIGLRKKHKILMDGDRPKGGAWNFDSENRKKIPKKMEVTDFIPAKVDHSVVEEVKDLVEKEFSDHPGKCSNYWIPVDRASALAAFDEYLENRFENFGRYQDALDGRNPFLYHACISPVINIGFLTPSEVIKKVEAKLTKENLNAVEGFIRQVLGWREFVRGIYQNFDPIEQTENFFEHKKLLTEHWYNGTTGIAPLDDAILKAQQWGYCHHIERLMVIGNLMLLLEVHPQEVYRWFMEMFVDSSDWVMGPNVFGMSQFSDGGIFATKPYMSGSNYIFKMSHYKKGEPWAQEWDGLYWRFIDRKSEFLRKNHRLSMMVRMLAKMDASKKTALFEAASVCEKRLTRKA